MNLNQITAPSLDLSKSIPFYKALALTLIVHSNHEYARFECPNGASFSLHKVDNLPTGEGIGIYFEVEDLEATYQKLLAKGFEFEQRPVKQRWLWHEARLKDVDGNQLILYTAGKYRLHTGN